ncbi:uncharacterized protein LOC111119466 isoform X3 [Crassostrea virginica]
MLRLLCVLVVLLSVNKTWQFFFDKVEVGEVTPKNPAKVVNEILELNCTVFSDSGLNSSLLFWEVPFNENVSQDQVSINGDRTLLFRKNITDIEMEGNYICRRKDKVDYLESMVGSVAVVTEYEAVRNVSDFSCILDTEKHEFRCSWKLGLYHHEAYLDVKIEVSPDNGMNRVGCPQQTIKESCVWTKDDLAINSMTKIVTLNITNKEFKVSKIFRKEFYTLTISKPMPTAFINVTSQELCGCANLTWGTIPGGVNTRTFITLMSQWNTVPLTFTVDVNNSLVVCNLVPATVYTVDVKLTPVDGHYYSNSSEAEFETCHMKPSLAPIMESSWYSSTDCADSKMNTAHTVTVYWQKIPPKYQNGPLQDYKVFLDGAQVEQTNNSEVLASFPVPCHGNHYVSVRGCNKQGCSPESPILIPNYKDVVRPAKVIMEQKKGSPEVYLTWFGVKKEDFMAVDIVWCKMKPAGYTCSDDIQVLRTNSTDQLSLHSDIIGAAIDEVLFGVAAINVRNMSSGIRWQEECRYFKDEVIPIVGSVHLMPDPPRNSLTLTWKPVECEPGSKNVYINQYQIFYCQLVESGNTCALGSEQKMNVSASNVVPVTLRNLNPKVKYGIWVRAVSLTKMGPLSSMVEGQPHNDDLSEGALVGIVIGGIFCVIFIIAGCTCVIRQIRKSLHLDEKFDIVTPTVDSISNVPSNMPRYHSVPLPSDRSSTPLITANGTTCNGTTQLDSPEGSCKSFLPQKEHGDRDCDGNNSPESISKGKEFTLPLEDIPRQISKDSGHESLSPTSLNPTVTPEESGEKNQKPKDWILNPEHALPHGYAKATTIAAHCLHGIENSSCFVEEECSPVNSKETSSQLLSDSHHFQWTSAESGAVTPNKEKDQHKPVDTGQAEIKVDLTKGYVSYQSCYNQTSQRPIVDLPGTEQLKSENGTWSNEEKPNSQTGDYFPKVSVGSDYVPSVLSVPDYVPNRIENSSPGAAIKNEMNNLSALGYVPEETMEEYPPHYVPNGSEKDYIPNGTQMESPEIYVPNGTKKEPSPQYVPNGIKGGSPPHGSVEDYVPNRTKWESPELNVPDGTKEETPKHFAITSHDESDRGYVPNGKKEESPLHYISNESEKTDTKTISDYIPDSSVTDYVPNRTFETSLFSKSPNGSILNPLPNEKKDLSEIGYVRHGMENTPKKSKMQGLLFDDNMAPNTTSPLGNGMNNANRNFDQRSGEVLSDANSEGESDGGDSCSYNSGYISQGMLDLVPHVMKAPDRPEDFGREEDDSVVLNCGYVPASAILAS